MGRRYTLQHLRDLEAAWTQAGYQVRYEKGRFQSGYCVLKSQKILIISRFLARKDVIDLLSELARLRETSSASA